jgi:hypothetical protein
MKLLSCLKKRDLLNSDKVSKSELVKFGEAYRQEGRFSDCIDFFEKAGHVEGLIQLKEQCAAEGDYFLYQRLVRLSEDPPTSEEWLRLGENALGAGKLLFALFAFRQTDHSEKITQVEKLLKLPAQDQSSGKNMLH